MSNFGDSLGYYEENKKYYLDVNPDERMRGIYKTAGTTVLPSLSVEGINRYITKKISSDMDISDGKIRVSLRPTKVGQNHDIKSAEGNAVINMGSEPIVIPIKINNGELADFTKLIIGEESYPYTRNVLSKIESSVKKEATEDDAYIGTSRQYNADTDRGFLDDAIQIRDEFVRKNNYTSPGSRFVFASNDMFENMLEKLSSISTVPKEVIEKLAKNIEVEISDAYSKQFEKLAIEIEPEIEHIKQLYKKIDSLPIKSIKNMKHGQRILFPERIGTEITMTQGVVFKNLKSLSDVSLETKEANKAILNPKRNLTTFDESDSNLDKFNSFKYIVVSADGRMAAIKESGDFLALEDNSANFKLPSKAISSVRTDEIFIPIVKDTTFMPMIMEEDRPKWFYNGSSMMSKYYPNISSNHRIDKDLAKFYQLVGSYYPFRLVREVIMKNGDGFGKNCCSRELIMFPGGNFDTDTNLDKKLQDIFGEDVQGLLVTKSKIADRNNFLVDERKKVLIIKGFITGYTKHKDELKPGGDNIILKFASDNTFYVEKSRKGNDLYFAKTTGKDARMLGDNLKKQDIVRMLTVLGYNSGESAKYIASLESNGKMTCELPLNANINQLYEGKIEKKKNSILKKIFKDNFDSSQMRKKVESEMSDLASEVAGSIIADSDLGYSIISQIAKLGEEAEGCSVFFEKLAMEHRNYDMQKIALGCTVGKKLCDFVKEAYEGNNIYRGVYEACDFIEKCAFAFEDTTSDLVELFEAQFDNGNEIVPYPIIKTAMNVLGDTLYIAQGINKEAKDAPSDITCKKCGVRVDRPLKDGKCDACIREELDELSDDSRINEYTNPAQDAIDRGRNRGLDDYDGLF